MDVINITETACSYILDLRNATSQPLWLVFLPMDWIAYYVVWPLVAFGTLSNISFIWTVIRTQTLHTPTYVYLVSLAFADLSLDCLFAIDYAASPIGNGNYIFAMIIYLLSTFAFMSEMGFVTLVSLERYLAICYPIKHHVLKGTKRTYRLIVIVLLISVGYMCVLIPSYVGVNNIDTCVSWPDENRLADYPEHFISVLSRIDKTYFLFAQLVRLFIWLSPLTLTCYMYLCILRTMTIRAENRQLNVSNGFEKQLRQVAIMVITNGTIFFLCCSLQVINQMFTVLSLHRFHIFSESSYYFWLHIVYLSLAVNSSINPLIYFITNQRYRKAFKSVFCSGFSNTIKNRQTEYNTRPTEETTTL